MANVAVMNMNGEQVGNIDLNDAIFGIEANEHVMHLAVVQYLANQRQGTQSTKTRAEVRGGGRKPWSPHCLQKLLKVKSSFWMN